MRRWSGALLALTLSIGACVDDADPTAPPTPSSTATIMVEAQPGWEQLEPPPLQSRVWNTTTWTGTELIVWGGVVPESGVTPGDSARFDATTRVWRAVAPAPIEERVGHTAVWTGEKLVIWGGHPGGTGFRPRDRFNDGAAYEPATDTWSPIAEAPLTGGPGYTAVWTGTEMVMLGGNNGYLSAAESGLSEGASYDPSSDSWRTIQLPMSLLMADGAWTGTEILLYGVERYLGELIGAAYHPANGLWRELPPSPIPRAMPEVELVGNRLVAWSYDPEVEGLASLDPLTSQWQMLPDLPGQPSDGPPNAAALGADLLLLQSEAEIGIYSFANGRWDMIPPPTVDNGPFGLPPLWTGTEALFYSGIDSQLWSYIPDPTLDSG